MTPSERRALVFLAAVAALGVGTRAVRSRAADAPAGLEARAALARQIAAVDSARRAGKGRGRGRAAGARGAAGGRRAGGSAAPNGASHARPDAAVVVDVDVAESAAIEALPGIGPTLAARVVADRDSNGAFGSAQALERVRGIGPALSKRLAPHVTFSGTPRPTSAELGRSDSHPTAERRRRSRARRRRPSDLLAPAPP